MYLKNCILSDYQFGFQTGMSSSMAIANLMEKITNYRNNMKAVNSVFIDLRKSLDTIDHTILLQKKKQNGIHGIVNQWVCSYLAHRKQHVEIKDTTSSLEKILCRLNDICNVSCIYEFTLFADYMNIIYSHDSTTSLYNTLNTELEKFNS